MLVCVRVQSNELLDKEVLCLSLLAAALWDFFASHGGEVIEHSVPAVWECRWHWLSSQRNTLLVYVPVQSNNLLTIKSLCPSFLQLQCCKTCLQATEAVIEWSQLKHLACLCASAIHSMSLCPFFFQLQRCEISLQATEAELMSIQSQLCGSEDDIGSAVSETPLLVYNASVIKKIKNAGAITLLNE